MKNNIFEWLRVKALDVLQGLLGGPLEASPKTKAPKNTPKQEPYMFITLKGKKFHYDPNCPGLHNAKVYKMELSKVRALGRKACDKCCYSYLHD